MMNAAAMSAATRKRWMAARVKHGGYVGGKEIPEHYIWRSMTIRCAEDHPNYEHVSVCKRWHKYENFLADMGRRPSPKHTLDRWPNPFGGYKLSNCRWATWTEQARNKRSTLSFSNERHTGTLPEWAERLGTSRALLRYRWKHWGGFEKKGVWTCARRKA